MKGLYCGIAFLVIFFLSTTVWGQVAGDYRSFATGNWNAAGSWETFNGTTWVAASAAPASTDGTITIQNLHTITITANLSIDQVIVASGGTLRADVFVTLAIVDGTGVDLTNNGTFSLLDDGFFDGSILTVSSGATVSNAGTIIFDNTLSQINFQSSSTYQHAQNGSNIPRVNWDPSSTCEVTGVTNTAPGQLDQAFGNFKWNSPSQSGNVTVGFSGASTSIAGNFIISDTGAPTARVLIFSTTAGTSLNITGNLTVSGTSRFSVTTTATTITVNVNGAYENSSSGTSFLATTGTGVLNVKGNFSQSAGALQGNSASQLNFNGATTKTFTGGGTFTTINFSVNSGATVDLGTSAMSGGGTFTNNGTIQVRSTDASGAIQTGTAAGNIRVGGARTYASGSTIVYNGASAQFTGNGHPTSSNIHTIINNTSGVTLAADLLITGNLTLTSGNLSVANKTLTLEGNFTPNSNFLNVASTSNLTINGIGAFGTLTTTGSTTINNFTINRTTSGSITLGTDLTIAGTLTQTIGDIVLNGRTLTVSGPYSRTNGSLNVDGSASLIINGTGSLPATITFAGVQALNTLTVSRAAATLATNSSLTITNLNLFSGTFDNTGTITIASGGIITRTEGSIINNTPSATTSYDIVYNIASDISTGSEIPSATSALRHVTKTGGALLTLTRALTINGDLTLSNGSLNAGTFAIDMKGNFVANAVSTLTSSAVTFSGTTSITGGSPVQFGSVTITGSLTPLINIRIDGNLVNNGTLNAGTATTTFGGTTTISGTSSSSFNNVTINASSTLTAPTGNFNVAGTWTNNGTFTAGVATNTVTFNGTSSIAGTSTTNFSGITISGTLNAPATLNVAGNFTNNGTFNRGTGTVAFNGSTIQSIQGSAVTDFNNINVTNTAGPPAVQVQSNTNLRGTLTLAANAQFDADGSGNSAVFTLISTADNPTTDAAIAALPTGASVNGNVTIQRYMAIEGTNSRMYRYISSPVQTPALSQIQSEIPVTGTFTGASTCSGCGTSPSMWTYNEAVPGDLSTGYEAFAVSANTETLQTGRGYSIYVRGNVNPILSAGSARWDARAPINSGTVSFPATFTSSGTPANDGWNLVGNPYPSTIDWDAAGWTKTNVNNAIYMRDNASGVVASYVGGVPNNGGSRYIPMGQGFFIQSTGSPTFSCTENVKAAGTQSTFFREQTIPDILRIALRQGSTRDETVIRFAEVATAEFDGNWDAHKLKNEVFNLSSLTSGDLKLAINSLPAIGCGTTVRLDLSDIAAGAYQIEFSAFESFSDEVEISVYDLFADTKLDVRKINSYAFEVTADPASFGADRFSVSFSYKPAAEAQAEVSSEVCEGQGAVINVVNSEPYVAYSVYRDGIALTEPVFGNGGSLQIQLDASLVPSGDNDLSLRYSPADCKSMVSAKQIKIKSLDLPELSTTDGRHCGSGSVSLTASGAAEGNYRWYETEMDNIAIIGASSSVYTTPVLNKSKTYYVSAINALGCEGARRPVMAIVQQYNEVIISLDANSNKLTSSYDTGNQWYFNGEKIVGGTGKVIEANETGLYEVEATVDGCTSRAGREMIVLGLENHPGKGYDFFPNPVIDKLTVELDNAHIAAKATVYNSSGNVLGTFGFESDGKKLQGEYNFDDRPAGLYLIRILQGNKVVHYRVIKK